jgi:DNA primase
MISPYQAGFKNIIAIKGTAFTKEQLQLLKRYTDTIILALDADFAGSQASLRSITLAGELDFDIKVLRLGDKYKDPDEAIKSDPSYFENQLQKAQPVWDFIIETMATLHDTFSPLGRKKFIDATLPFIIDIKNEVIKRDYLQKIAYELSTDLASVQEEAKKISHPSQSTPVAIKPKSSQSVEKERQLITLILSTKSPSSVVKKVAKQIPNLKDEILQKIWLQLPNFTDASAFQNQIEAELQPLFQELFLRAQALEFESETKAQEIHSLQNLILIQNLKQQLSDLSKEIARLESRGEDTPILENQYNQVAKRLTKLQSMV